MTLYISVKGYLFHTLSYKIACFASLRTQPHFVLPMTWLERDTIRVILMLHLRIQVLRSNYSAVRSTSSQRIHILANIITEYEQV